MNEYTKKLIEMNKRLNELMKYDLSLEINRDVSNQLILLIEIELLNLKQMINEN